MSLLLSVQDIRKIFGAVPLFENLSFGIFEGDRVGVIGPNGSGKSTLMKILAGVESPDGGTRSGRKLLRLGYVPQDPGVDARQSVEDIVTAALAEDRLEMEEVHSRVGVTLAKVGFPDVQQKAGNLSGGWTKRLAIACALVRLPDLLLMDEPTNHLDVEGILWLEKLLRAEALAYLVVSHDRYFLENVTNRIIELNRCYPSGVFDVQGNYSTFLEKRDEELHAQERYQETLANRVRGELEWLKRGAKARTRKSGARIEETARMQEELVAATNRATRRSVRLEFNASDRKTTRLLVVNDIEKRFGSSPLVGPLSLTLTPGMRLGILGPNGSGKTTLLQLLAGEVSADGGSIERADELRLVYLDQHRERINSHLSLRRTLAPQGDQVVYRGRPLHVASWARRFLFPAEQLEMPVGRLSGGERARVAIAQLMLRPADVLMLDEPTNDLDIPTLEVLEESLLNFPGALVLVTHDRFLFERVTNVVLALDGKGGAEVYADYRQWEDRQRGAATVAKSLAAPRPKPAAAGIKRLSYSERREWEQMETAILSAEEALEACRVAVHDPSIASNSVVLQQRFTDLHTAQGYVDRLYARWAALEAKQAQE